MNYFQTSPNVLYEEFQTLMPQTATLGTTI